MTHKRNVAIFIFDDVEVLDFAGPFEVFNVTGEIIDPPPFHVYTVAQSAEPVYARGRLSINPHYTVDNCPAPDILLVPGGFGTRALMKDEALLAWLREQAERLDHLLSVCTGSLVLGAAGLLEGLEATTHHTTMDLLRKHAPGATIREDQRFVDNGQIITSGGISAGIDMALYVVSRLLPEDQLRATLKEMEYDWEPERHAKVWAKMPGLQTP